MHTFELPEEAYREVDIHTCLYVFFDVSERETQSKDDETPQKCPEKLVSKILKFWA